METFNSFQFNINLKKGFELLHNLLNFCLSSNSFFSELKTCLTILARREDKIRGPITSHNFL